MKTPEQRFLEKIEKTETCWLWKAHAYKGYGVFSLNGKQVGAHRAAYTLFVGPIPEGLQIDHLCRVPMCVNPDHLEPVTPAENLRRSPGTWAGKNIRKTHCPSGHPLSGDNMRRSAADSRYCLACKREKKRAWDARAKAARATKLNSSTP